jgi:universal stress protein E
MNRIRNILVGVDLSDSDRIVSCDLSDAAVAAIEKAIWLGETTGAKLTFFAVLMPCLDAEAEGLEQSLQPHLMDVIATLRREADAVLAKLVEAARAKGINAEMAKACGTSWFEITRKVIEDDHDLVIVGSHKRHALGRVLLGSTGHKLVRKCPCPVWVVSPHEASKVRSILLAHDLTDTSQVATELAIGLTDMLSANLHVLHVVEYPFEIAYRTSEMPDEYLLDYRGQIYRTAHQKFDGMLVTTGLDQRVSETGRHVMSGDPAKGILELAVKQNIDLVVMGTIGRSGLKGMLMGNVAEAVLPNLKCSVLAVKPEGFVCPIRFAEKSEPAVT